MMQLFSPDGYSVKPSQFFVRLIALLLLMLVGNVVFLGIAAVISLLVWGYNFFEHPELLVSFTNPVSLPIVKLFQALQTIGLFLVPGVIWAWFYTKPVKKSLHLRGALGVEVIVAMILLIILAIPMINWLAELNGQLVFPEWLKSLENTFRSSEARAESFMVSLLKTDRVFVFFINIVVVAVLPAIAEEVFFRGVLQNEVERITQNPFWAVLITAFVFSAFHFQFFSFLPRFILGIMLGFVYVWSRNLWVPVLLHFINNGLTVFAWFWFTPEVINKEIDTLGTNQNMWILTILSIVLVVSTLYYVRHYFRKQYHN